MTSIKPDKSTGYFVPNKSDNTTGTNVPDKSDNPVISVVPDKSYNPVECKCSDIISGLTSEGNLIIKICKCYCN